MSKIKLQFAALMFALILPGAGQAQDQSDYFPLSSGMSWAYGDSFHVVRVTGMMKSLPPIYTTDYAGQSRYFIKQDDGKVLEWRDGKRRLLYDFGAKAGASWTIEPLGDGFEILDGTVVTVVGTAEAVTTPYGAFRGCVHLGMRPRAGLADAGVTDMWFAPGVGLVKWSEVWIGGVRSFSLTRFSTGAPEARLKLELTTDREVYGPGDTVSARYRMVNVSGESMRLTSGSGLWYDFILEGPEGKVWQWSDGRAFTLALVTREVGPGDSVIVRETFSLPKAEAGGTYVLKGFLVVSPEASGGVTSRETEAYTRLMVVRLDGGPVHRDSTGATLTGSVVEDVGMTKRPTLPVEGARVNLTAAGDMTMGPVSGVTTQTDRLGQFAFGGVKPDVYVLTVSKAGFVTSQMKVDLTRPGEYREDVSLRRETAPVATWPNFNQQAHRRTLAVLETDREGYAPGDSVLIRYRLVNTTRDTLRLMFRSGQRYDFVLEGPKGRAWGWSDNKRFIQALGAQDLAPGDTLEVREAFVMPNAGAGGEGTYVLTGFVTVTQDAAGALSQEETEVPVKFGIGRTGGGKAPSDTSSGSQTALIKGDFNRDNRVDFSDFFMFAAGFGKRSDAAGFERAFDLDEDGEVGFGDFLRFADDFGKVQ